MSTREEQVQPARGKVQVGDSAPDFTLPDQSGKPVSLGGFLGKTDIVLYFYPRDDTAVCTAEACAFRDSYELFKQVGAEVIGISSDSVCGWHNQKALRRPYGFRAARTRDVHHRPARKSSPHLFLAIHC